MPLRRTIFPLKGPLIEGDLLPAIGRDAMESADALRQIVDSGVARVLLEDCHGAEDLQTLDIELGVAEARGNVEIGRTRIVAAIGSAQGLAAMASLSGKSGRLAGIAWDPAMFCRAMEIENGAPLATHATMTFEISVAALGLPAFRLDD